MRLVYCSFSVIGFHRFPDAPADVSYLARSHRHEFKFRVGIEVSHENREIEFHILKRRCVATLQDLATDNDYCDVDQTEINFGPMSCEMIAEKLMVQLLAMYPEYKHYTTEPDHVTKHRQIIIDVSEDGECGGIVSRFN